MNVRTRSLAAAVLGLAGGIAWNASHHTPVGLLETPENQRRTFDRPAAVPRSISGFTKYASGLSRADWPAFFRTQLNSPEHSRLAAKLWAEADPDGFWKWLREERDPYLIERFALDLLRVWAEADPDGAMTAALQITRRSFGDLLRQAVIGTVLDNDLQKGIELAARAGEFGSFTIGSRPWITRNPAEATLGLASLPCGSPYRHHLEFAIPAWFDQNPAAALEWLKSNKSPLIEGTTILSFKAAAKFDPQAALAAALNLPDPHQRSLAISGVISAATLDPALIASLISQLPISLRGNTASRMIEARPARSLADLQTNASLLEELPSGRDTLTAVNSLARQWVETSPSTALQWIGTLPDPASRRAAYSTIAITLSKDQLDTIGSIPVYDLSNDLFRQILFRLYDRESRETWIRQLPAEHAAWARSLSP